MRSRLLSAPDSGAEGRSGLVSLGSQAADFLFVLPALALVGGLLLYPIGNGVYHSLYNWHPGYASPFVGFANYTKLAGELCSVKSCGTRRSFCSPCRFGSSYRWRSRFFCTNVCLSLASRRTLIFYPAVASPAILGIFFRGVLAPTGLLNSVLGAVGLDRLEQNWLADPKLVKPVLICIIAWATAGVGVIIFTAALSAMEPSLLEAAEVEGASSWQRIKWVVFPALRPVIDLYFALMVLTVFVGMFGWIYVLTSGGPGYASTTLDFDIYQRALVYGQFGLAAAESVYLIAIVVIVVLLARRLRSLGPDAR